MRPSIAISYKRLCQSVRPSVRPSICPSVPSSVPLSICPSVPPSVHPSVGPSVRNQFFFLVQNEQNVVKMVLNAYKYVIKFISLSIWMSVGLCLLIHWFVTNFILDSEQPKWCKNYHTPWVRMNLVKSYLKHHRISTKESLPVNWSVRQSNICNTSNISNIS